MKKTTRKKANVRASAPKASKALRLLGEAVRLLREERNFDRDHGRHALADTWEHFAGQVEQVVSHDHGECGLQPFLSERKFQ